MKTLQPLTGDFSQCMGSCYQQLIGLYQLPAQLNEQMYHKFLQDALLTVIPDVPFGLRNNM
jgi:hypothetical protein